MRTRSLAAGLLIAASLTACDPQRVERLEEGVSTEVEVRRQFGEPATVLTGADGSRVFEYPRQPEGWTNYLITIGVDGKMSALRQLLAPDNFARVLPGLDRAQVRQLLGRPAKTQRFDLKGEEVWDWRFKDGQNSRMFSVTFGAEGRVLRSAVGDDPRESMAGGK
jgi:outer membrane protein assembly factor BamE (lipoprotein component of BamABCDE complex)